MGADSRQQFCTCSSIFSLTFQYSFVARGGSGTPPPLACALDRAVLAAAAAARAQQIAEAQAQAAQSQTAAAEWRGETRHMCGQRYGQGYGWEAEQLWEPRGEEQQLQQLQMLLMQQQQLQQQQLRDAF